MSPIIDAHAHVFRPARESVRGVDELAPAERDAPASAFIERLRAAGVDRAVLVPLDEHHEYVSEVIAANPDLFDAVIVASRTEQGRGDTSDGDPVQSLKRRRETFPFRAVRTMWLGEAGTSLRQSPMLPLLRHMSDTGLILWSYLPPDQARHLPELATLLPDLRIVLNHLGFTPHAMRVDDAGRPRFDDAFPAAAADAVAGLARFPGMHLMFSGHYALSAEAYPYRDLHDSGRRLVDAFGADRTLWGSDSPWIDQDPGYTAMLELVDIALPDLSPGDREAVTGGTVARLLASVP